MLIMDQIRQVRERYYEGGESLSQIARDMNLAWRTVRKYVDKDDFNENPASAVKRHELLTQWRHENLPHPKHPALTRCCWGRFFFAE